MPTKDGDTPKFLDCQNTVVAHMMTPGVVQIPGDVTVTEAAGLLDRERMPCLLVKDTESCFGLMTPTDIVKKVISQGLEPDDIEVRTIMTRPVQFIEYDRLIDEASTRMMESGTTILIVTKEEQPVGVLTARDLILSPKRCLTNIPATIHVLERGRRAIEHPAVILQLSHIGALLKLSVSLLPDTAVRLSFTLPDLASPMVVRGTILSDYNRADAIDRPPGTMPLTVDIQFTDLTPTDQSRIKSWAIQHASTSADPS